MHDSLVDLSQQASLCANAATVRGVLAESQDLARNAVDHGEDPQTLVTWYSKLVSDVLHSEGVRELTGGATIILTGPVGRGDALPSSPVKWLTVGAADADSNPLLDLLEDVGIYTEPTSFGTTAYTQEQWSERIADANCAELSIFADAGTWCLEQVLQRGDGPALLWEEALKFRPKAPVVADGLPVQDIAVNIRKDLLYPIIALARWAGVAANSNAVSSPARLEAARQAGVLSNNQTDDLMQAWEAGLSLQFRRFADRVHRSYTTAAHLPAIQRSIYGASSRLVAGVYYALEN